MSSKFHSPERTYKVLICGDYGVGKTTLCRTYLGRGFTTIHKPTIGVDFFIARLHRREKDITLQLWDFSGQERFKMVRKKNYRGAAAIILMYEVLRANTLHGLWGWIDEIEDSLGVLKKIPILIVGNKIDVRATTGIRNCVSTDEGIRLMNDLEAALTKRGHDVIVCFSETSALTGENIQEAMGVLVDILLGASIVHRVILKSWFSWSENKWKASERIDWIKTT